MPTFYVYNCSAISTNGSQFNNTANPYQWFDEASQYLHPYQWTHRYNTIDDLPKVTKKDVENFLAQAIDAFLTDRIQKKFIERPA